MKLSAVECNFDACTFTWNTFFFSINMAASSSNQHLTLDQLLGLINDSDFEVLSDLLYGELSSKEEYNNDQ